MPSHLNRLRLISTITLWHLVLLYSSTFEDGQKIAHIYLRQEALVKSLVLFVIWVTLNGVSAHEEHFNSFTYEVPFGLKAGLLYKTHSHSLFLCQYLLTFCNEIILTPYTWHWDASHMSGWSFCGKPSSHRWHTTGLCVFLSVLSHSEPWEDTIPSAFAQYHWFLLCLFVSLCELSDKGPQTYLSGSACIYTRLTPLLVSLPWLISVVCYVNSSVECVCSVLSGVFPHASCLITDPLMGRFVIPENITVIVIFNTIYLREISVFLCILLLFLSVPASSHSTMLRADRDQQFQSDCLEISGCRVITWYH